MSAAFCTPLRNFLPTFSGRPSIPPARHHLSLRRHAPHKFSSTPTTLCPSHAPIPLMTAGTSPPSFVAKGLALAAAAFLLSSLPVSLPVGPNFVSSASAGTLNSIPFRLAPTHVNDEDVRGTLQAHWDVHSSDSHTETFVVFSNKSSHVIDLWWVDYCGTEVFYASINPGTMFMQQSFTSHPWVVRDHLSHNSVLMVVATTEPLMAVVNSIWTRDVFFILGQMWMEGWRWWWGVGVDRRGWRIWHGNLSNEHGLNVDILYFYKLSLYLDPIATFQSLFSWQYIRYGYMI